MSDGLEAERGGEAEAFGRDGEPALQDQPGGERQVEEDMRQHDAVEPVDLTPAAGPASPSACVQEPRPAEDGEQAQDGDDRRAG